MHELSITQGIVDAVAERFPDRRVNVVRLEIGRLSGVLPDAVRFCFDVVAADTVVQGARLEIDEPGGRARCRACSDEFELDDPILLCRCGSASVEVLAGADLRIVSVEVDRECAEPADAMSKNTGTTNTGSTTTMKPVTGTS